MLKAIRDSRTRLDRTMEVSVVNIREKKRLIRSGAERADAGPHHGRQSRGLCHCRAQGRPMKGAHSTWRRLIARRGRAVRLVEELGLRTQRLQPILEKVKLILRQMEETHAEVRRMKNSRRTPQAGHSEEGTLPLDRGLRSRARTLLRRRISTASTPAPYNEAVRLAALDKSPSPGISQPRPEAPHSGREHG